MTDMPLAQLTARIDGNLRQLPVPGPEETSRGLLAALALVRSWLDEPGLTWIALKSRVDEALQHEVTAHKASVSGPENIPAYARADALSAVSRWMAEFEKGL